MMCGVWLLVQSWLDLMSAASLSRLGARSGALLPGSIVKMSGHFAPVRVDRINMVDDGFVVKNVGTMNE